MSHRALLLVLPALGACGAATRTGTASGGSTMDADEMMADTATKAGDDPDSRFGPLEVGADYHTFRKVTPAPFLSLDHGNRWVDVWVNEAGADAYLSGAEMPVGTIVVKDSVDDDGGEPGTVRGPIYVMEKRAPGYAPEHGDWYMAIHWAEPTPQMRARLGGPIYWRDRSPRVGYCYDCHDGYDRGLGGLTPSSTLPR